MRFKALCDVHLDNQHMCPIIKKDTIVTLEQAREHDSTVHVKLGVDCVLKRLPASIFTACFKRIV